MKKSKLDPTELHEWLYEHWNLYSSQMYNGKLLRLWVNGAEIYRVTHGHKVLYEGRLAREAIAAWNKA